MNHIVKQNQQPRTAILKFHLKPGERFKRSRMGFIRDDAADMHHGIGPRRPINLRSGEAA